VKIKLPGIFAVLMVMTLLLVGCAGKECGAEPELGFDTENQSDNANTAWVQFNDYGVFLSMVGKEPVLQMPSA